MKKKASQAMPFLRRSGLQSLDEFRHGREQVGLQAVVGHREDRRLGILVDGEDARRTTKQRYRRKAGR